MRALQPGEPCGVGRHLLRPEDIGSAGSWQRCNPCHAEAQARYHRRVTTSTPAYAMPEPEPRPVIVEPSHDGIGDGAAPAFVPFGSMPSARRRGRS